MRKDFWFARKVAFEKDPWLIVVPILVIVCLFAAIAFQLNPPAAETPTDLMRIIELSIRHQAALICLLLAIILGVVGTLRIRGIQQNLAANIHQDATKSYKHKVIDELTAMEILLRREASAKDQAERVRDTVADALKHGVTIAEVDNWILTGQFQMIRDCELAFFTSETHVPKDRVVHYKLSVSYKSGSRIVVIGAINYSTVPV